MPAKFHARFFPVACLLYTASMWGVIWYPLRWLQTAGMAGVWSSLFLYLVSLLLGLVVFGRQLGQIRRQPLALVLLALTSGWTNVAFVLAVIDGTVVRVLLLFYLSPLWAVLLGWLLLKERITPAFFLVLVLAMTGALVMLWSPDLGYPWPHTVPDWLAISSGLAFALSNVFIRQVQDVSIQVKTTVSWLGVVLVALLLVLLQDAAVPRVAPSVWLAVVLLGIFATFFMTLAVQYGVTHMPVHRSAVILLFELVAGAISSQLLTAEVVSAREWWGGALILLAGYFSAYSQVKTEHESTG